MQELFHPDPDTIGSKGLVFIGDALLVYRRDGNTTNHPHELDLPGGAPIDEDKPEAETPFETFRREVKEEFGLNIGEDQIVYSRRYESRMRPGRFAHFPVVRLAAEQAQKIKLGDEGEEFMLITPDDFIRRDDVAWPILQSRATDYIESQTTSSEPAPQG